MAAIGVLEMDTATEQDVAVGDYIDIHFDGYLPAVVVKAPEDGECIVRLLIDKKATFGAMFDGAEWECQD